MNCCVSGRMIHDVLAINQWFMRGVFVILCMSFFERGGALAHITKIALLHPSSVIPSRITNFDYHFRGYGFPHAGPVVRAGRLHLECSRMRRTLSITWHVVVCWLAQRHPYLFLFPFPPAAALSWPRLLLAWSGLWRAPPFVLPLFFLSFSS